MFNVGAAMRLIEAQDPDICPIPTDSKITDLEICKRRFMIIDAVLSILAKGDDNPLRYIALMTLRSLEAWKREHAPNSNIQERPDDMACDG